MQTGSREGRIILFPDSNSTNPLIGSHDAVVLPGSQFWKPDDGKWWLKIDDWIRQDIAILINSGDVRDNGTHYTVINLLVGSVNGVAAAIEGSHPGNGYNRFKCYSDGKTLQERGYRGR